MLPQQSLPAAPEDSSTEISGQEPSQSLAPASERGWRAIQIAIGVALPLVAGVLVWGIPRLWAVPDLFDAAGPFITALVVTALLTFVRALLLHSSWALGIVPATWVVGETLGTAVAYSSVTGRSPLSSALWWQEVGQVSATLALLGIPLTLICAGLGVLVDRWLQRRRR